MGRYVLGSEVRLLTALVGGDNRVREAHRESVRVALDEMEKYAQARIGGNAVAQTTGAWAMAKFEHDSSRPVDGYAAPQLHTHAVIFNVTETAEGKTRSLQAQEPRNGRDLAPPAYMGCYRYREYLSENGEMISEIGPANLGREGHASHGQ